MQLHLEQQLPVEYCDCLNIVWRNMFYKACSCICKNKGNNYQNYKFMLVQNQEANF